MQIYIFCLVVVLHGHIELVLILSPGVVQVFQMQVFIFILTVNCLRKLTYNKMESGKENIASAQKAVLVQTSGTVIFCTFVYM